MLATSEIEAIKSTSIADFLRAQNVPSKRVGSSLFFAAPYRNDPNPSLKVDERTNKWYDFGTRLGGDIIDLVKLTNNTDFIGAVRVLQAQSGLHVVAPSAPLAPLPEPGTPGISILSVVAIYHKGITDYLHERNIDLNVAKKYCKQVNYRVGDKTFFALGLKNESGGYELRNKYFKGCTKKDITIINPRASEAGDGSKCVVFEGFMDYLSYQTMRKRDVPRGWTEHPNDSAVILNSVANVQKVKPYIEQQFAVAAYMDNDEAGQQATREIRAMVKSGHPVWDASVCYQKHKDLNEYLMSLPRPRQALSKSLHHYH
jgi:hypothetical protein